jgi:predicted GNAT superfamily acetyltransferase
MTDVDYRDLTTLEEFSNVVELERTIWGPGYVDVVPVPIFAITVKRGGILAGAFSSSRMIGFVYSIAGIRRGKPTQWSHMLGVLPEFRNDGIGHQLKLLQRERALSMGLDLIEWTYDPMQALNAHLNFTKLGVVVEEYEINVYGTSNSPLHAGNPTDRFVAEWKIAEPHVAGRLARHPGELRVRTHELSDVAAVNVVAAGGSRAWPSCDDVRLGLDARRLAVQIPMGFTEMLIEAPALALEWRLATREIFTTYFARGYQAVDFILDRRGSRGTYLLARAELGTRA